jgi:poly(U)-specific endoribonuclease
MWDHGDFAEEKLFTFVDAKIFEKPTFKAFHALLDNYSSAVGVREVVTPEELRENRKFLEMVMDSHPMQYTFEWLKQNKRTSATTREDFITELDRLWFGLYRRKVDNDSSGFEHVFCGEVRDSDGDGGVDEVTGLHNWIVLYLEEQAGRLDYQGFIKPRRQQRNQGFGRAATLDSSLQLITTQFIWNGCKKPCSSSFIGVSPEFEMALYTLCWFFNEEEKNIVTCGPYRIMLTAYRQRYKGKDYIGTAFPSEAPLTESEGAQRIQRQFRNKNFNSKHGQPTNSRRR